MQNRRSRAGGNPGVGFPDMKRRPAIVHSTAARRDARPTSLLCAPPDGSHRTIAQKSGTRSYSQFVEDVTVDTDAAWKPKFEMSLGPVPTYAK